jgi:hypothetical protein
MDQSPKSKNSDGSRNAAYSRWYYQKRKAEGMPITESAEAKKRRSELQRIRRKTLAGKLKIKKWNQSEAAKNSRKKWSQTEAGKMYQRQKNKKRRMKNYADKVINYVEWLSKRISDEADVFTEA